MIIAEETVQSRLDSPDNLANKIGKGNRKNHANAGRKEGDENLHPVVRNVIGLAAMFDTAKNVAEEFNVSAAAVHNYKHNKTTGTGEVKEEMVEAKKEVINDIHGKAVSILMKSLNILDDEEKLKASKVTTLSSIAKDMASVIEKTSEKKDDNSGAKVIIITAPRREIDSYKVVNVESSVVEK